MLYSDEIEIRLIELFFSIVEFKHILNSEKKRYFNLYKKPNLENQLQYYLGLRWIERKHPEMNVSSNKRQISATPPLPRLVKESLEESEKNLFI